ncbi:hypothetical protein Slin14017_G043740 [Septoria linicola]|nr:hypothetical protein Slin14017_G043740 [Septoria linicola]
MNLDGTQTWQSIDRDVSSKVCQEYCQKQLDDSLSKGSIASGTCVAIGDPIAWQYYAGDTQIASGKCACNDPFINQIIGQFVNHAIPAIEEVTHIPINVTSVTCKTWVTALRTVLQAGISAIPGIGGAIGSGVVLAMQAAETAAYTFERPDDIVTGFQAWIEAPSSAASDPSTWALDKACGNQYTPPEAQQIFGAFNMASAGVGAPRIFSGAARAWPPPFPKGSGSINDMLGYLGDLGGRPKGKGGRKGDGKSDSAPATTASPQPPDKPKQCARRNGRRAPGPNKDDCEDKDTITVIGTSVAANNQNVQTMTCDGVAHTQACAHYYSMIHANPNDRAKSRFTCEDANARNGRAFYTRTWHSQHHKDWRGIHDDEYIFVGKARQKQRKALQCEADKRPPAYFIPRGKEREKEWGQRIRLIPSGENGGAGNLWQGFCAQHDGGKYNNQRVRIPDFDDNTEVILEDETEFLKEKLNEKLLAPLGKPNTKIGDKADTHSYATVTYTRAVFELEFNWGNMEVPSAQNNWYLDKNPCWPRYIAGDDPGFVLLADDPWYDGHPDLKKRVDRWARPPTDKEKADAAKAKAADESSDDSDGPPPAKAPKLNPPAADSRKFKRLDLVDGRLVLRDEISNATRPLTADEIRHNVEVSDCADRHCSRERRNGEDSLFLPGSGPPPTPSVNVAVPTMITSVLLQARAEPASLTPAVAQVTAPSRLVV